MRVGGLGRTAGDNYQVATGADASQVFALNVRIGRVFEELVATGRRFELGDQRAAVISGDLALTSTRSSDGTVTAGSLGARAIEVGCGLSIAESARSHKITIEQPANLETAGALAWYVLLLCEPQVVGPLADLAGEQLGGVGVARIEQ
jgi:hypothetical protein